MTARVRAYALAAASVALPLVAAPAGVAHTNRVERGIRYADHPECILDVRVPGGETNFPTVVWLHGGGLSGGARHFLPLADEGIAQVAVDYRLLGKGAAGGDDCIDDAAAAVAWTLEHIAGYGGDSNRVFVAGHSAGGFLSLMVGMDPARLAAHGAANTAIAGVCAVSGQVTKHFNVRRFEGDPDPQFLPKLGSLAPLSYVSKDLPPILCVCGEPPWEWKARAEENRFLVASLAALGHPFARYVECPRCDHGRVLGAALPYLEQFIRRKLP